MIWAIIPSWLKYSLAAVLAAFVLIGASYLYGKHEARQEAAVDAAAATAKAIEERAKTDAKIGNMDVRSLCLELGGVRDDCDKLRGVQPDPR